MTSVWMNSGVVLESPINISLLADRGFIYGQRVMTTMLVQNNHIIDFDRHIARLEEHAEIAGLGAGFRSEVLGFELSTLLSMHPQTKAACRVFLTAGPGRMRDPVGVPARWIQLDGLPLEDLQGVKLHLQMDPYWRKGSRVKTGIYSEQMIAVSKVMAQGFSDILWCNSDQELCETTTANIFCIGRDGDLVEIATPPESSGLLPGITRRRVIELLTEAKIPVTERVIYRDEIPRFDEAFVTSSIAGLVPVTEIGHHSLHTVRQKSVFSHIRRLFHTWRSAM